jgi:aryl-alcohol dehydrogenase-like predicted oxidoreductase
MELRGVAGEEASPRGTVGRLPSEEHAGVVLNAVLDGGINFVDTAPRYGRSEEFIGRFISHRRDEFFLATKMGNPQQKQEDRSDWERANLLRSIDRSLELLKTDRVDILQLHNPTPEDQARYDCIGTLKEIQAAGKTRFIGISTTLPEIEEFLALGVFDTFQIPYSALSAEHEEMISKVAQAGAGTIIRGGVGEGVPAGGQSTRQRYELLKGRWDQLNLEEIAGDMSTSELTLRYTFSHPDVHSVIVGTQNPEHLRANLLTAELGGLEDALAQKVKEQLRSLA